MNYELIKDLILVGVVVVVVIDNFISRKLTKMVEENAKITNSNFKETTIKHNRLADIFKSHMMKCHNCKQCNHCKEEKESE